jgi:predicted ATPase/DNA-binding CsgD family transcriptional regulator/DNA-binding XRE family transcriptional regulator
MMAHQGSFDFGDLVRQARLAAGLTQEELAERAGLSVRGISDLERGLIRSPRRDTLALLADALALSDDERQYWLELRQQIYARSRSLSSNDHSFELPHDLPDPLTSFVGRKQEQADVVTLLGSPEVRLLTITGPGGVGKTRLAIAVAHQLRAENRDGVRFVDLVPVREPDQVLPTIAAALRIRDAGTTSPLHAIAAQLRRSTRLLLLDNMEHVAASASDLVELLSICSELTILATSRSPLRVQGEWEYPLPPLELPAEEDNASLAILGETEAVALFTQRARLVKPDFQLTDDNAPAVVAVCRALDGLPLAIEMAAARIRPLPPESLLKRLRTRLPLLVSKDRDLHERHRTLRATIQWSYNLLTAAEQRLYRTLSVFHSGWTLEAAESIAGNDKFDVLGTLEQLIDQSFVRVHEQTDGTIRFSMLETIREFGLEQLQAMGESETARCRHASYILALIDQASTQFRSADEASWMARLEAEHANLRAALQWTRARASQGDSQALSWSLRLAGEAWWFWFVRGHLREARDQLDAVVQLFRDHRAENPAIDDSADAALAYAKCLFGKGCFAFWMADIEHYDPPMQECRAIYQRFGHARDLALWLIFTGFSAQHTGNFKEAEPLFDEGIVVFRELDDHAGIALGLLGMGETRLRKRQFAEAAGFLEESLARYEHINNARGIAAARATLGAVRIGQRDYDSAGTLLSESIRTRSAIGDKGGIAWCLERLAQLALADPSSSDNSSTRAARLLGAARVLRDAIGSPVDPVDQPMIAHLIHEVQQQLSETAFIAAWEAGRALPFDDVIEYAIHFRQDEPWVGIPGSNLSRREIDVLKLLVEGYSNQQMAETLFISHHTVARHVKNIMNKLGVESRTAAATWATRNGLA